MLADSIAACQPSRSDDSKLNHESIEQITNNAIRGVVLYTCNSKKGKKCHVILWLIPFPPPCVIWWHECEYYLNGPLTTDYYLFFV